jgi:phage shock protein A
MALINRMARLFTADVHAVLDRMEEPDVLLKHAIREMEEELASGEQRVRSLEHERAALAERHDKIQAALAELAEQLDVCFGNGTDELARKVVKRKLETERLERHISDRRTAVDKQLAQRRAATSEQREQLDVLRQKAELLTNAPASGGDEWGRTELAVGDAEVEVAYLRERAKRRPS